MERRILLDMDGVLSDFLSGALIELNKEFHKNITLEQYVNEFGKWETYDYYGITEKQFWGAIQKNPNFWVNLLPTPYGIELYHRLRNMGQVTIVTTPSNDPNCTIQKYQWLDRYFGLKPSDVFIGGRKYLFAGNGILIDDYYKNVDAFTNAGGKAILIPSVWNTSNLTYEDIDKVILTKLYGTRVEV